MMKTVIFTFLIFLLSGLLWYLYFSRREHRLIGRLQALVDQALSGTLKRGEISETKLSALENSLKRYLDDSLLAKENQHQQKAVIQGLISDIAHQTLTPISNLKIYSELLKEEGNASSETIEILQGQTEKLDFLIQSLVKLSRMESGIITVHPVRNQLSKLLQMISQESAAMAHEKQIILSVCQTDIDALFDFKWTLEALSNIVDNAIKYTSEGGRVAIRAEKYSFFARIDIEDTGPGIEESEIPLIFTRFYRSLSAADQPGVGIGLYLAREIIQAQKGYIKVTSEKGKGSVFSVFLML